MNAIDIALPLIQNFEGFRSKAYICPSGEPTIGYGSTGPDIRLGMVWSEVSATKRLRADAGRFSNQIDALVKVALTPHQKAALISFVYNIGINAFSRSTLLKKLNAGDYAGAGLQLLRWDKADGRTLAGLTARRRAEKALWETAE